MPTKIETRHITSSPHHETFTFAETAREFDEAVEWLASQGLRVDGTRVSHYRKVLKRLADDHASGRLRKEFDAATEAEKSRMFGDAIVSLYESGEIISIAAGLRALVPVVDREKFRELLKGASSYINESTASSAKARNTSFEFIVASRLVEAGLALVRIPPADVCAMLGSYRLVVECKRPQTESSIEGNIDDAFSQLRRRLKNSLAPRMRGIAAIDVTKAANPNFQRIVAPSIDVLGEHLNHFVADYATPRIAHWVSRAKNDKIIGVLFRFSGIAEITSNALPTYHQQYTVFSLAPPDTAAQSLMRGLAELMRSPPKWAATAISEAGATRT